MKARIHSALTANAYWELRTVVVLMVGVILLLPGVARASGPVATPFIQQLSQPSVAPGGGDLSLTITGSGFSNNSNSPTATVLFIGPAGTDTLTPTSVGSTCSFYGYCSQVTVTIPKADTATAGMAVIIVENPTSPTPLESNAVLFPISISEPNVSFANSSISVGTNPRGIAAGDFNGDGKQDLAIVNSTDNTLTILLGNGDGTFTQASGSPITLGNNLQSVAVIASDFNNDGILDLAVANETDNSISILIGVGDGTFTLGGTRFSTSGQNPVALAAVDLDGDGNLDLAVVNQTNLTSSACKNNGSVALLLGDGTGNFSLMAASPSSSFNFYTNSSGYTQNPICVGASPNSIAVADFSGDGLPDLAVTAGSGGSCNPGVGVVTVMDDNDTFLGDFPPPFNPPSPVSYCAGKAPTSLVAGDFNKDGMVDVAVSDLSDGSVSILLNTGTTFAQPALNFLSNGAGPSYVVAGDFNSDQNLDLAVVSPAGVSIMPGDGTGNFNSVQGPFNAGTTPFAAVAADFNGDGRLDLAISNGNANAATIMLTSPPLSFTPTGLDFGNVPENAVSTPQSIQIMNISKASVSLGSIGLAGPNAGQFRIDQSKAASPACSLTSQTLTPTQSCNVAVVFVPTNIGDMAANVLVQVTFGLGTFSQSAGLHGSGLAPVLQPVPLDVNFEDALIGTTSADSAEPVTITNVGVVDATISSISITGANLADFSTDGGCLSATLTAGSGNCSIGVSFKPTGGGLRAAQLNVTYTITGGTGPITLTVGLAGNGAAPLLSLSSAPVTFGYQQVGTTSGTATVSLTNLGTWPLTFSGGAPYGVLGGANPGDFAIDPIKSNCISPLAISASCSLTITFTPAAPFAPPSDPRSATLTFTDNNNAVGGSKQSVVLTGTATGPVATLSTSNLGFGGVPITTTSVPMSFLLTNTGNAPLAIKAGVNVGIAISGANAADFSYTDNCPRYPSTIAVNANCTITVKVTPTAVSARNATLTITDNDRHSPTDINYQQTVSLGATGTDFSLLVTPPTTTVSPGKFATYSLAITPISGFNQTLSLACVVSPTASKTTCALPNSVAVNGVTAVASVSAKNSSKGKYTLTFTTTFTAVSPATGTLSHSTTATLTVK